MSDTPSRSAVQKNGRQSPIVTLAGAAYFMENLDGEYVICGNAVAMIVRGYRARLSCTLTQMTTGMGSHPALHGHDAQRA